MKKLSVVLAIIASGALLYACWPLLTQGRLPKSEQIGLKPTVSAKPPVVLLGNGNEIINDLTGLPKPVADMRERLITAAGTGNITRLKIAFETNETPPVFSSGPERDPVSYWKKKSGDGEGREVLGALANILSLPAGRINIGKPTELTVWPYLATIPLATLTPEQKVDLYRLLPADEAKAMTDFGAYIYWRVGIGKDGTLHYFKDGK